MPYIGVSREDLHRRLKAAVATNETYNTMSKAVELLIEFGLDAGVADLTKEQRLRIIELVGEKGLSALLDEK